MSLGTVPVAGGVEPRRRLNPLSPLLNSAKMVAALIAVISIQGFVQLGWRGGVGVVVVVMCLAMAFSAISWLVTGYHLVGRELRVYDGILVRRARAIPLERLQSVELVRPLLARGFGLAELRLEVVGGGKTEAPLAFLTLAEAAALRERLLALANRAGAPTGQPAAGQLTAGQPTGRASQPTGGASQPTGGQPAAGQPATDAPTAQPVPADPADPAAPAALVVTPGPVPQAERPLHRVVNRQVLISQLLTPQVMFLPLAIVLVATQYLFRSAWSLVVLLSMLVAVVGVVQQPVRRILSDWNFRLALQDPPAGKEHPGLRIRHGLTETRSQTVPLNRIQAVTTTWPLLWRRRQWLHCRLHVAGITSTEQGVASDQLLPVGELATARALTSVVLPGVDLTALRLTTPPARARWVAPVRAPILGAALTEHAFAARDGRITRQVVIVPYQRIQSVRVVQGPLQRQLGLATVHADTAGSGTAIAHHRDLAEARWLAGELTARAARARAARGGGGITPPVPVGPEPGGGAGATGAPPTS